MGLVILQQRFTGAGTSREGESKNYNAPQQAGFAELAMAMKRNRQPAQVVQTPKTEQREKQPQRIVIENRAPAPKSAPPRYYSNQDDAQAATRRRMLKMQALTSKPVVEDFQPENGSGGDASTKTATSQESPYALEAAAIAALTQQRQTGQAQAAQVRDPNGQTQKTDFLRGGSGGGSLTPQGYSGSLPVPQQFSYELKAGTIIPGILLTGINSDLPGNVIAQVSENVWDTATGRFVLIPKGTRILGVYDSQVSFGQKRILLVWNRLIFPNGTTLNISGSPGIDQAGYSGLSGRVNEHWGKMIGTALLASAFVAGAEIVYDRDGQGNSENKSPRDVAAESVAGSILDMSTRLMERTAGIQPTITIRPGKKLGIFVQEDVVFPFPYF
jgi:type IV secretion system protein VirB10